MLFKVTAKVLEPFPNAPMLVDLGNIEADTCDGNKLTDIALDNRVWEKYFKKPENYHTYIVHAGLQSFVRILDYNDTDESIGFMWHFKFEQVK